MPSSTIFWVRFLQGKLLVRIAARKLLFIICKHEVTPVQTLLSGCSSDLGVWADGDAREVDIVDGVVLGVQAGAGGVVLVLLDSWKNGPCVINKSSL